MLKNLLKIYWCSFLLVGLAVSAQTTDDINTIIIPCLEEADADLRSCIGQAYYAEDRCEDEVEEGQEACEDQADNEADRCKDDSETPQA